MQDASLLIRAPRQVLREMGYTVDEQPGDVRDSLTGAFEIEPSTGFACAPVTYDLTTPFDWYYDDSTAYVPGRTPEGWLAQVHKATDSFLAWTQDTLAAGDGFVLAFLPYASTGPVTVQFGDAAHHWKFQMELGGVSLYWQAGTADDWHQVAWGQLWEAERWVGQWHVLYVYCIGRRLVLRTLGVSESKYLDADPPLDGFSPALQPNSVYIKGSGALAWQAGPELHEAQLLLDSDLITMPQESTQAWTVTVDQVAPTGSSLVVQLRDDAGDIVDTPPLTSFAYHVALTVPREGANGYVKRVNVTFPPLWSSDGSTPTDLDNTAGISVPRVELRRPMNGSGSLTATVNDLTLDAADLLGMNVPISWTEGGAVRFTGYTVRAPRRALYPQDRLTITADDCWKLLRSRRVGGGAVYDGMLLSEAYTDILARAGFSGAQAQVTTGQYLLPDTPEEGEPAVQFKPELTCEQALVYLRDHFGADDMTRCSPTGVAEVKPRPTTPSGVTFLWETPRAEASAIAAGAGSLPIIQDGTWEDDIIEEGFANRVNVIGQAPDGTLLHAEMIDWDSVNDSSADNYWGDLVQLVVTDPALTDQATVNWVCNNIFDRVRQLQVLASCAARWQPNLQPGDLIEVEGRGTWRIRQMPGTEWSVGWPDGLGRYELERVST
jgi:hypothetical protein